MSRGTGWSEAGVRRRVFVWIKRGLLVAFVMVFGLAASGAVYQAVSTKLDERRHPAPGEMVDVGGYRLHLDVMGEDREGPTVILDAGSQSASFQWGWVEPEVSKSLRVVAYDRPGTGWSDAPPGQLDARELAGDLHEALGKAGLKGPYVVVGHSMGSLTARAFAERYPDEVIGAVLVDPRNLSLHEDFPEDFPEASLPSDPPLPVRMQGVAARLGIVRLLDPLAGYEERLPPRQAAEAKAYVASDKLYRGMWPDIRLAESAVPALRDGEHFQDRPLVVLSAGEPDAINFPGKDRRQFTAMHERMARDLSSRGEHLIVRGADHLSIVADREYARQVAGVVDLVVDEARSR